jgi:hypothetical protein
MNCSLTRFHCGQLLRPSRSRLFFNPRNSKPDPNPRFDEKDCFRTLSSRNESPRYYEMVSNPMSWDLIQERLDAHTYWDLDHFRVWIAPIPPKHTNTFD